MCVHFLEFCYIYTEWCGKLSKIMTVLVMSFSICPSCADSVFCVPQTFIQLESVWPFSPDLIHQPGVSASRIVNQMFFVFIWHHFVHLQE